MGGHSDAARDQERQTNWRRRAAVGVVLGAAALTLAIFASTRASDDQTDDARIVSETSTTNEVVVEEESDSEAVGTTVPVSTGGPTTSSVTDLTDPVTATTEVPTTQAQDSEGSEPATSEPTKPQAPPDDVAAVIDELLNDTADAISANTDVATAEPVDLSDVATDAVLSELEATKAEFEEMGWSQIGTPTVVHVDVVTAPDQAEDEFTVEVCLDNSGVRIVDANGDDVRTTSEPSRSMNIYTFRWIDGRWLAAEHTFPDDPTC